MNSLYLEGWGCWGDQYILEGRTMSLFLFAYSLFSSRTLYFKETTFLKFSSVCFFFMEYMEKFYHSRLEENHPPQPRSILHTAKSETWKDTERRKARKRRWKNERKNEKRKSPKYTAVAIFLLKTLLWIHHLRIVFWNHLQLYLSMLVKFGKHTCIHGYDIALICYREKLSTNPSAKYTRFH